MFVFVYVGGIVVSVYYIVFAFFRVHEIFIICKNLVDYAFLISDRASRVILFYSIPSC